MPATHPLFATLRQEAAGAPVVVAHRGDSAHYPENTIPAFTSAHRLGVRMQEFDVRATRDAELVCIHDATLDRTTDAASRLGPGALVAQTTFTEIGALDAGSWRGAPHAGTPVPRLADVLQLLVPQAIPLVEHKAGDPERYLRELRRHDALRSCIVQSFDWTFVREIGRRAPEAALAVLGPNPQFARPDAAAVEAARSLGAGMLHWRDADVRGADVAAIKAAGLLLCTYTTDCELGWRGGASLGVDAMCTNDPREMLRWRAACAPIPSRAS